MPVKIIATFLALLAASGCSSPARGNLAVQRLVLSRHPAGSSVSLAESNGNLTTVYCDWESAALVVTEFSGASPLPMSPPPPTLVDKVDISAALTEGLGENAASAVAGAVHVLYLDRQREDRKVLKWASRTEGASWDVDTLEPAGIPVAVLPGPRGSPTAFWAADSMLYDSLSGGTAERVRSPFSPASRGSPAGAGFTAYDQASRSLLWFTSTGYGWSSSVVPGGRAVHCSAITPAGRLAVATYAVETHRVLLLEEQAAADRWKTTTVTISAGTRFVYLAPYAGRYVFLYDGVEGAREGGSLYTLSLLVPSGPRYNRTVVWQGSSPIDGEAALLSGGTLSILVVSRGVELLRVTLP